MGVSAPPGIVGSFPLLLGAAAPAGDKGGVSAPPGMEGSFSLLPGNLAAPAGDKTGCAHFAEPRDCPAQRCSFGASRKRLGGSGGPGGRCLAYPAVFRSVYPDISIPVYPGASCCSRCAPPLPRPAAGSAHPSHGLFAFRRVPCSPIGRRPPLICIPAGAQPMVPRAGRAGPGGGGAACAAPAPPPLGAGPGLAGLGWAGLCRGWAGLQAQGRKGDAQGWLLLPFLPLRRARIASRAVPPPPLPFPGIAVIWPRGIYFYSVLL